MAYTAVTVMLAPRMRRAMAAAQKVVKKDPHREKMAEMPTNNVTDVAESAMTYK
jgi:hypothetical protein